MAKKDVLKEILKELRAIRRELGKYPAEEDATSDILYEDLKKLVVKTGSVSIALILKNFDTGYMRAATLLDALSKQGVIESTKSRRADDVFLTPAALKNLKRIEKNLQKRPKEKK